MEEFGKILKALLAVGLVAVLIIFGFFLFAILFGIACIAGLVMWLRKKNVLQSRTNWSERPTETVDTGDALIIEGEAEEVKPEKAANSKK